MALVAPLTRARGALNSSTCLCLYSMLVTSSAWAAGPTGIKLDGTLGPSAAALAGPVYGITQNLGKLSGGNLFFSFQYFNVATGETALFTTTSAGINNVISRVTGGYASTIDGKIELQPASGAPNFFLINPAGVTFTANAVIDVPAAFYVSTANYLKFSDGNFYVDPGKMSTLSTAAPEAFGFLGTTRAPVNIQGATLSSGVAGSGEFEITAGDVTIDGFGSSGGISNTTGDVRVIAVGAQTTEVPLTGTIASDDGAVTIQNGGSLTTIGSPASVAGSIYLSAATLQANGEGASAQTGLVSEAGGGGGGPLTVDVAGAASFADGAGIVSHPLYSGAAADITLTAGSLTIQNASSKSPTGVATYTDTAGNCGAINVTAGTLVVDGTGAIVNGPIVGIESFVDGNSSGLGGNVAVTVIGATTIGEGGGIYADTSGIGRAGNVTLTSGSLEIDGIAAVFTGISSSARTGSSGNAGQVLVSTTGATTISNGGEIQSDTSASGKAGGVTLTAGSLSINGGSTAALTGIDSSAEVRSSGSAGQVSVITTGATTISNGGDIQSVTFGSGNAGGVTFMASSLTVNGGTSTAFTGISSAADPGSSGNAGYVSVTATGATTISNGGAITSDTDGSSSANAGRVTVTTGSLSIAGGTSPNSTGITSDAGDINGTGGSAGSVSITVGGVATISNGGSISSDTRTSGNAGDLTLTAGTLNINGGASPNPTDISSNTEGDSTANAGKVTVKAGSLSINGGTTSANVGIFSDAGDISGTGGSAGTVSITIAGAATIVNGGAISSDTFTSRRAGDVTFTAGSLSIDGGTSAYFTGISSDTDGTSNANAGRVAVTTGSLSIVDGGGISSDAGDQNGTGGTAGTVSVTVSGPTIISSNGYISSDTNASGNAGNVTFKTGTLSLTNGGYISSDTGAMFATAGNAGDVSLTTGSLSISGNLSSGFTGISSTAYNDSSGNAGRVSVTTIGATTISNAGQIESATFGVGNAGDVTLKTASLSVGANSSGYLTGIDSDAESGSGGSAGTVTVNVSGTAYLMGEISSSAQSSTGGQPGTVKINVGKLILDANALVSIENYATVADPTVITPTQINIQARNIEMNGGQISAASSGNVDASSIEINYGQSLRMNSSTISTSAQDGNGGPITIDGAGPLIISHSDITTSVLGTSNGNGGDISINVPVVALDTGAIQANTAAPLASGGTVTIDAQALVPSYQSFILGGSAVVFDPTATGFNVVQAAAPDGVNAALRVTVPTLDLGNALLGLTGHPAAPGAVGRGLCGFTHGSSLAIAGHGGVAPTAYDPLSIGPEQAWRAVTMDRTYAALAAANTPLVDPEALFACR